MTNEYLPGLQSLRGLAALMVLIGHALAEAEHYFALALPGDFIPWTRGVDVFFVISGFVVTLSARRYFGRPGAFFRRRMVRVVPLYFLFTSLMIAALILLPGGTKDTTLDPAQILSSYTFFPYERSDGRIAPVLSLGWTLNYEVFFYGLLALSLALPRPLLTVSICLIGLATIGLVFGPTQPQAAFWTNPIVMEFLFGIALARLWQRGWRFPSLPLAISMLGLGAILLVALDPYPLPRFLAAGLPATLIAAAATLFCPRGPIPGQLLGDASYALYLSHRFALRAATLLLVPLLPSTQAGAVVYVVLVCGISLALGVITYRTIERPLLIRLSRPRARTVTA